MVRNKSHTLAYSLIGLQELNLAYKYPVIYWNCANLIVDSGSLEDNENNKSTNYGKIATAIGNIQKAGTKVELPLINEAQFGFKPDEESNSILYSLKAICGVGEAITRLIIENRPFTSMEDFYTKMCDSNLITPSKMIQLIKAGCFIKLDNQDKKHTMRDYLHRYKFTEANKLTLSQLNRIRTLNMVPDNLNIYIRYLDFEKYVLSDQFLFKLFVDPDKNKVPKSGYHDRYFKLDEISMDFLEEQFGEDSVVNISGSTLIISEKKLKKQIDKAIQPLLDWLSDESTLKLYNEMTFNEIWNSISYGTESKWEMDALSFYYSKHELADINESKYGIVNFFTEPEIPEVYDYYTRWLNKEKKSIPKYTIKRIAGTVLDTDNNKHKISLLTVYGVVEVKFNKGQFTFYNKQISEKIKDSDKKTVLDTSWFKRGTKIIVCGYRSDNSFRAYRYNDTIYTHTVSKIDNINEDGTLQLITEREEVDNG